MDFANFGTVSFTTEAKAIDFINYLEQGKVMATRCNKCGISYFPPKMDCPKCLISDMNWLEIKGNGKLITYTVVNYGPSGFEHDTPYILAIGEFEDGVRIFGRLSRDIEESDIEVGMSVKVAPVKLVEDKIIYELQKA